MFIQRSIALALLLAGIAPAALAQPVAPPAPPVVFAPPAPPPPPAPRPERPPVIEAGGFLSREEWPRCDGFGPAAKRHDGMTRYADLFVNTAPSRSTPRFGQGGIVVCNAALADPRMLPEWSLRRANILQARALHKAAVRDFSGALADLASSDEAAGTDRYTLRSMGATNNLIRGWLRMEAGEKDEAVAALREAAAARPWEAGLHGMVLQLNLAASSDWETYRRDTRQLATLDPNRLVGLYALAMTQGDFAEAAALYPQINLTVPRDRGGYRIDNTLLRRVRHMVVGADLRGGYAYALAASGKAAEAAAELAQARAEVERAVLPPKPLGRRTELTSGQRGEHAAFSAGGEIATKSLDRWDRLLRLKAAIGQRNFQQAFTELQRSPIGADGPALDVVRSLIAIAPAPQPQLEELSATMTRVIATQLDAMRRIRLADLFEALPEPESARAVPPYDGGSDGWLSFDTEGYRVDPSQVKGAQTIRFARSDGTMAMASEMVLLRAAELARKNGHRGFILAGRRMIRRELLAYGQAPGTGTPSGQEAELDVVFVDPARLPPQYADAGWRVLDAERVWNELAPLYPPPRARSASR